MKLIVQIPCHNEEETLEETLRCLPRELPGIDDIEYLVVDDGSTDCTVAVAREAGAHHLLSLGSNEGLATAFMKGIHRCLELGADIIVNTDGDNQYKAEYVKDLVAPILDGRCDIVVGTRPIETIREFSWMKRKLQRLGSWVVRRFSGTDVPDTTSGFRAYSAEAAMRLHVFNRYTYTLETIIQAGHMRMRIGHVPIKVNPKTRESRLISSIPQYVLNSISVIIRAYVVYQPFRTFLYLSLLPGLTGALLCARFLYYFFVRYPEPSGHTQSLILAAILIFVCFLLLVLGILGSLLRANRELVQEALYDLRSERVTRR